MASLSAQQETTMPKDGPLDDLEMAGGDLAVRSET